jgi:hypothetical protein
MKFQIFFLEGGNVSSVIRILVEWNTETGQANIHYEGPGIHIDGVRALMERAAALLQQQSCNQEGIIQSKVQKTPDTPLSETDENIKPPWLKNK